MDKFSTYLRALSSRQRIELAARVKTSPAYLSQIASGHRNCGESLAIEIEKATLGAIRVEDLCPAPDWAYLRGSS